MAVEQRIALPLHPEYRTLPMVWYVPPLSPFVNAFGGQIDDLDPNIIFPTINQFRIPIEYLANLFTAGDTEVIKSVLKKLVAMRTYMRQVNLGKEPDTSVLQAAGMTEEIVRDMYELSAIAKYSDRYVIPASHKERTGDMHNMRGNVGFDDLATDCNSCSVGSERDPLYYYGEEYWSDLDESKPSGL